MSERKPERLYAHNLLQTHEYKVVLQAVEKVSPVVPVFDYKGEGNIEEIKFKLAQKQMHDLVMKILKGEQA